MKRPSAKQRMAFFLHAPEGAIPDADSYLRPMSLLRSFSPSGVSDW